MPEHDVSLVIPAYHGLANGLWSGLKAQSLDWREAAVVNAVSPAARARNLGARQAAGKYLIFIDDDVTFNSPLALQEMIRTLKGLGPKDAVLISWRLTPRANWVQRKLAGDPLFTFDRTAHHAEISWRECDTGCFAISAGWFAELGGFDEDLVSGEDCDLAFRLVNAGGKIYVLPHFWFEEKPPATVAGAFRKALWYERGNAQVARKHPRADHRVALDRGLKALGYLLLRTAALLPLMFFKVNYRQRWPRPVFRPFETLFSYVGAWAYVGEWLFPGKARAAGTPSSVRVIPRGEPEVS